MYRKKSPNSQLAKLSFDQLSEEDKDKNRAAVKGIPHKLASLGYIYELKSSSDQSGENTILSEDAELLARLEHDRWIINKIDDGHIYGEFRDDSSFSPRHPDLVPWDDIDSKIICTRYPEYIASKLGNGPLRNLVDIELAKEIPEILSSAGYRMFKVY